MAWPPIRSVFSTYYVLLTALAICLLVGLFRPLYAMLGAMKLQALVALNLVLIINGQHDIGYL